MAKRVKNSVLTKEVQAYLDQYAQTQGVHKLGRLLSRSFSADAKFNRFLASDPSSGLAFFTDKVKRHKMMDEIDAGTGLTSIDNKRALTVKMLNESIDTTIEQLKNNATARGTLALNEEQRKKLTDKLIEHRNFLTKKFNPAIEEVAEELGILEDVQTEEAVNA